MRLSCWAGTLARMNRARASSFMTPFKAPAKPADAA